MSEPVQVQKIASTASLRVNDAGEKAIKSGSDGTVATFVMSSLSTDRDGERISPDGWTVPKGNVNVLVDHCYEVENVVGKIVRTWVEGDAFMADVLFADNVPENELAKFVVGMLKADFLGPVSVGFMPMEWKDPDGKTYTRDNPGPMWGPLPGRLYTKQELLELSMVAVGSNRDAMLVGMRAFGLAHGAAKVEAAPTSGDPTIVIPEPEKTAGDDVVAVTTPESWFTKYLRPEKPSDGAALSREQIDRLTEAKDAAAQAMRACEVALQSAMRAGVHE